MVRLRRYVPRGMSTEGPAKGRLNKKKKLLKELQSKKMSDVKTTGLVRPKDKKPALKRTSGSYGLVRKRAAKTAPRKLVTRPTPKSAKPTRDTLPSKPIKKGRFITEQPIKKGKFVTKSPIKKGKFTTERKKFGMSKKRFGRSR